MVVNPRQDNADFRAGHTGGHTAEGVPNCTRCTADGTYACLVDGKRFPARSFEPDAGNAPVRDWLLSLSPADRKAVGEDIRTAEFGWPIGMPLCRAIAGRKGLWEIRTQLEGGRIARVMFCARDGAMVLLHGFVKKSQKTPDREIDLAERRMRGLS